MSMDFTPKRNWPVNADLDDHEVTFEKRFSDTFKKEILAISNAETIEALSKAVAGKAKYPLPLTQTLIEELATISMLKNHEKDIQIDTVLSDIYELDQESLVRELSALSRTLTFKEKPLKEAVNALLVSILKSMPIEIQNINNGDVPSPER